MITIIDYAVNNLNSVEKAFRSLKIPVEITENTRKIREADKLVLPGVGAFGDAVNNLKTKKIFELLREKAETGTPILGLCLGLQLFFTESEEFGPVSGLDFIHGKVQRLPKTVQVPHIGWNQLYLLKSDPLLKGVNQGSFVYFVHSYYATPFNQDYVLATTEYGTQFTAVVRKKNVWATQFHPEKSQDIGLRILHNFSLI
ncbi:MAG: imidazole glycerol phosphate synthase subunit HisH [Acidobacteriia bacterium]|nr:imidazole glycerol phosphate synthase subunit HisH [Terriglobia bacterium]